MCVQSVCYANVIGLLLHKCERILILCLMIQCLIISENRVHGDGNTTRTFQQDQKFEIPSNRTSRNATLSEYQSASAPKNHNAGNVTTTVPQSVSNTSSNTIQPALKIISPGAFVRAFYVFVGLGAIIVMYIVVRTIRLRRKKTAVRKYGVLASREDVELTPLGAGDEDEDVALFDMTAVKSRP